MYTGIFSNHEIFRRLCDYETSINSVDVYTYHPQYGLSCEISIYD